MSGWEAVCLSRRGLRLRHGGGRGSHRHAAGVSEGSVAVLRQVRRWRIHECPGS